MNALHSKRASRSLLVCLLLLLSGSVWISYTHIQQAQANRDLLLAVSQHNPKGVKEALNRGANPNIRQTQDMPSVNLLDYVKSLFHNKAKNKPPAGPAALALETV
jgi:hypothetical protein